ncbi:MAG: NAD-dependent malic enzyme [Legionellales bacterium]|nr:NAD-dependent malic enzyme [Legionellales bacterium]
MKTNASNSITVRIKLSNKVGSLSHVMSAIADAGGSIGAVDINHVENDIVTRDITIDTVDEKHAEQIIDKIRAVPDVEVVHYSDRTFLFHLGGKIEIKSKNPIKNRDDLSMAYTPGVARVCMAIHNEPENVYKLTCKRNTIAVVTDGTAVLGLGDIGPEAAMPVMEGKAMLFKDLGGVDAYPICLATKDVDEIVKTVKYMAPGFGGINLEDISAPRCFEVEARLKQELDIPVFHDDQHGTAVVLTAAFINAMKIVNKKPSDLKIVVSGVGAAGVACTKMLQEMGVKNIIGCDSKGVIAKDRGDLNSAKQEYLATTNPNNETGTLKDVIKGADVFVGLSAPDMLDEKDIKGMASDPVIFAMANPRPEIMPEVAGPHVAVMATGRSDYPNQINNVLAFPGIFRGALDCYAKDINSEMQLAAAYAIANVINEESLSPDYIVPSVFDTSVAPAVAEAVIDAARQSGVARK